MPMEETLTPPPMPTPMEETLTSPPTPPEETLTSPPTPMEETLTSPPPPPPPPPDETLTSPPTPTEETLTSPPTPMEETLTSPPTPMEETLTSPPHSIHAPRPPALPLDLISEILCRLSVKLLLQLRCVCKSWNSLISDPEFAKKHFSMSTTHSLNFVFYDRISSKYILTSYPLDSVFTDIPPKITRFEYSIKTIDEGYTRLNFYSFIGSCNGILCIADDYEHLVLLWNPSIRKINELPPFQNPPNTVGWRKSVGFGYDSVTDNYKVAVVLQCILRVSSRYSVLTTAVEVHTIGTNFWKRIPNFPFANVSLGESGKFVSGTINWPGYTESEPEIPSFIVSFDLGKESFYKISLPDHGGVGGCNFLTLGVLRDCLCVTFATFGDDWTLRGVWIMKEYGNRESWTKLFNVSYMGDPAKDLYFAKPVYIFEDDQVLLNFEGCLEFESVLYDSRNGTLKLMDFESIPAVCVESLISPCS